MSAADEFQFFDDLEAAIARSSSASSTASDVAPVRRPSATTPPIPARALRSPAPSLFSDDAGRDLVDLVDRGHFQLADKAHETAPVFKLGILDLEDVEELTVTKA